MTKPTSTLNFLPAWMSVVSMVAYWGGLAFSGWYSGVETGAVYSLMYALLPAFVLQIAALPLYIFAFRRHITDFKMPNYWMAFIGSLATIQFLIIGLFLTVGTLFEVSDLGRCPQIPTLFICDVPRLLYTRTFLMIQNGLWLPLGIASLKAATRSIPPKGAPESVQTETLQSTTR